MFYNILLALALAAPAMTALGWIQRWAMWNLLIVSVVRLDWS